jgi:BCD family chlorophyll transporter-like MFS transporter
MRRLNDKLVRGWIRLGPAFMPFADVVTEELPLGRLLRLSLFQVTVGMAVVLLIGTLNRVMIVELGVPAWLVAVMVSLPLMFAPARAVIGHHSDHHRSVLGWKRVPYIWFGTLLQFGGLAIMPFALIVLSGDTHGAAWIGQAGAGLAFLLVGAGLHTTQTVGLALATDLAPEHARAKVVTLMCAMLLVGMVVSAIAFGLLLANFSQIRLIQVIQGAALLTMGLNILALWKQEARDPSRTRKDAPRPDFRAALRTFSREPGARRRLIAVGLGTIGFSMQDILLEPYGGQILKLPVAMTTTLTALLAVGGIAGFVLGARLLARKVDPFRVAALGVLAGLCAFAAVIFAAPLMSATLFGAGTSLIGLGSALFLVGTLTAAMAAAEGGRTGLAIGTWGAVQAFTAGAAIALGGIVRDVVSHLAESGALGDALTDPSVGYSFVYHLEILLLFATLVALGPLVRSAVAPNMQAQNMQTLRPGLAGLAGTNSWQPHASFDRR